mgnify:CR=1 FL=1
MANLATAKFLQNSVTPLPAAEGPTASRPHGGQSQAQRPARSR